ncbi:TlpA disulfide reductase family protein [Sphingobacterium sp. DR205]|uniref:TlpA family protein disulfide reductase n=1 Tax=Sphingobacterium sp. DR205 TaxID=2713573 RepID=UPI0013E42B7C|nr:TlpA disulfide reductase family protein [Sphingobacterium sp. DR205]QIH35578.1 TlpA family protein disulfide reductase [Sphingobacterium sp. DR205]
MLTNKNLCFVAFAMLSGFCCFGQGYNRVKVKINLHGIDNEKLVVRFDDGIVLDELKPNQGDSTLLIDRPINTPYPRIGIIYNRKYCENYFIDDNVAVLNLFYDANKKNTQVYSDKNINITVIDTISNKFYGDLRKDQEVELSRLTPFFKKHGHEIRTNDSVKYELVSLIKAINAKSMNFLAANADDFFSFYYFKDQVLGFTSFMESDSEYFTHLLAYYNSTFPEKFRQTGEGKQIATDLKQHISPVLLKENMTMPEIHFKDSHGDSILYKNQKENFVLLDFWASWCSPCVQQIADIKALAEQFSTDSLKIVSISIDRDSISHINSIKQHKMDWVHSLDRGAVLSGSLGVTSVPTVLLLDRNRKIVYYKNGGKLDVDRIRAIIRKD